MKLADHAEHIRTIIETAFGNRLGRMGVAPAVLLPIETVPAEYHEERKRIETIREVLIAETGTVAEAYGKLVEEFTFTLFNRLAALKVMEAHTLHPEVVTRRPQHGDRSFAHKHWLEENPDGRSEEMEGLVRFMEDQLTALAGDIPLFSPEHPYHLLPTAIELNNIINAFNAVEVDPYVETDIWQSDDVLGWLYESYNNTKKQAHKDSKKKIEFDNVSLRSQTYTPRWVVKFLVDNSLGKLYLEMYPDSEIKNLYKIANAPQTRTRELKLLTEIRIIDPATGSGNFLLYAFDLFYDLYTDQIEQYGADYDDRKIAELILTHNLHGADLDDRAIQLAQLGLYIKAKRKKRSAKIEHFNIVSSDFYLPEYAAVKHLFESEQPLSPELEKIVIDLWADLQQAYKFGTLIRLEEKFSLRLHGLIQQFGKQQIGIFDEQKLADYESFRENFFTNLQKAVTQNTAKQGQTFLNTKTQDAITFLQLLTQKYDVAVANPPYTDNADFGPDLKEFIEANYSKPHKFNSNLYAAFIKRCHEVTTDDGYLGMVHPFTFMFIKTFEDVRKLMIDKSHIELLVDYGLDRVNLFDGGNASAPTFYTLSKIYNPKQESVFFKLTDGLQEKDKKQAFLSALDHLLINTEDRRYFKLRSEKLKDIAGWPFIYWISDALRKRFKEKALREVFPAKAGLQTANNEKFLRFWWEVDADSINKKWYYYSKGGTYNKWYGNIWLTVNWANNGSEIKSFSDENGKIRSRPQNENYYKKEGITFSTLGSKSSFRLLPVNHLFDMGGSSLFPSAHYSNIYYVLGLLNSKLSAYIVNCLNPTVNTQIGDLQRIPFVEPLKVLEDNISALAVDNIAIKQQLCSFQITETNFQRSALLAYSDASLKDRIISHLNFENAQIGRVLLNESVINGFVNKVYELSNLDCELIESKMGKPVGEFPVSNNARKEYLLETVIQQEFVRSHIANLPAIEFESQLIQKIKAEFSSLYQSNNDLEDFCIRHKVNPINVWYWFKESRVLPQARAAEMGLEFLADAFRFILMADDDGIVPLVGLPGEPRLMDRFEQYCFQQGFNSAQLMQLDGLIGRPMNEYIEHNFFKNFSDHLNYFMYLPKTPFIWHLSSGLYQGFEAYIIIYKWNRDSLYKLKSSYLSNRTESLHNRVQQLGDSISAQAQGERETIRLQLQEIEGFAKKIDDLIGEGYDPKLDDGVGKNIAPLQEKGMLRADVLNPNQLQKYLNADW